MENKIIYVDFKTGEIIETENHTVKQPRLDPVLEKVQKELTPQDFVVYKSIVDDWMRRNFEYQMDNGEKMY